MAIGVSMSPGMIVLTLIPWRALASASDWPRAFMPALEIL
jgi:hypothetical protein